MVSASSRNRVKRTLARLVAWVVPLLLVAWSHAQAAGAEPSSAPLRVLEVAPLRVACAPDASQSTCLLVRSRGDAAWHRLDARVDGFTAQEAVGYRLLIRDAAEGPELVAEMRAALLGDLVWRIEAIDHAGVRHQPAADVEAWLRYDADAGRLALNVGCNSVVATLVSAVPGRVALAGAASTRMACPEPRATHEQAALAVLAGVERVEQRGDRLVLSGAAGALELSALPPERPSASVSLGSDDSLQAFTAVVAAAALAEAAWVRDPIAVALAYAPLWDVARVTLTRRDTVPEGAKTTVIRMVADGFLDDSLAGFERVAVLALDVDGGWRLVALSEAQRCARGDAVWIDADALCP